MCSLTFVAREKSGSPLFDNSKICLSERNNKSTNKSEVSSLISSYLFVLLLNFLTKGIAKNKSEEQSTIPP